MPDQETIERIQQEVVSANKAKLYERKKLLINTPEESPMQVDENGDTIRQMLGDTKTKTKPEYTSAEVKSKHHNWLRDQSINKELTLADYINVKHKSLFERLKGFFK